ncbi:MAG: beta-ketoacyl-ACP synthase III [Bacteroidetes bacterium]|jgi:3-oxoacyl-[acyl-carrier-protein] synthase-3|nr:beta-ketoacyl-ACP synthase III [Bacteroidota bacterium]
MHTKITALSTYIPEKVLDNAYFEAIVDTSDEWITSRTGIHERRSIAPDETTTDLAVRAVENLTKESGAAIHDVDFIIVSTITQEQNMPSIASQVQNYFQIPATGAIDITAACAGFVYGISMAHSLVAAGTYKKVLVISAEALTKFTDYSDRTTCILFGDAAGAALIEHNETEGILKPISGTFGDGGKELYLSHIADTINGTSIEANNRIHQNGRAVYKWAVQLVPRQVKRLLDINHLTINEIDWFVPHSANLRMIEAICAEMNYSMDKVLESVTRYGNTSSSTIPLALHEGVKQGKLKQGDLLLLIGFGGGLTYSGVIIRW